MEIQFLGKLRIRPARRTVEIPRGADAEFTQELNLPTGYLQIPTR